MRSWVLFDWGNTLMRTFDHPGPMCSWPKVEAMPGAQAMLAALQGRAGLALATNAADSQEHEIRKALAMGGLDPYLEHIFCFRSVGHKKASPPFFAHVRAQLELPAQGLLMVGDDFEQDVLAAKAAGIRSVWFNARNTDSRSGTEFCTIHGFHELPPRLATWGFLGPGYP